jgi:hypothetical protein
MMMISMEAMYIGQLVFKFKIWSEVPDTSGPSARLILQYQTTSIGATSDERYTKHFPLILMIKTSEGGGVFMGSLKKCYSVL